MQAPRPKAVTEAAAATLPEEQGASGAGLATPAPPGIGPESFMGTVRACCTLTFTRFAGFLYQAVCACKKRELLHSTSNGKAVLLCSLQQLERSSQVTMSSSKT